MTRTTRYKIQYAVAIGLCVLLAVAVWWQLRDRPMLLVAVAVVCFIPGRLSGGLWRDLYRGRRLHDLGQFEASIEASQRFVRLLKARPNLRRYWWLAWAIYSRDPLAMAHNNIGASQLELGELENAESSLQEALNADPEYPIPHYNLAVLYTIQKQSVKAEEHANSAVRLGYPRNAVDRLLQDVARLLARIEGRGQGPRTGV